MAEEKAAEATGGSGTASGPKPTLFIILAVVNMLIVAGVGFMIYKGKQKEAAEPKLDHVIKGEAEAQAKEATEEKVLIGKVIPLETFIVNIAGSKGRRVVKVNMEFEVEGEKVADEIDKRKPQIRDIIIIILSSKTYEQIATREGKDSLRSEIRDTVNSFLVQGKITNIFFTELLYN